jgi:hypothetical protein
MARRKINCANGKPLKISRPSLPPRESALFSEIITEPKSKRSN